MGQPVHKFLEDFDDGSADRIDIVRAPLQQVPVEPDPAILAAQLDEAFARGFEAGEAQTRQYLEPEMARIQGESDRRIEEAESAFARIASEILTTKLSAGIDDLRNALADQLGAVLHPVMVHFVTEDAIRGLVDEMRTLMKGRELMSVELSGPAELTEKIWNLFRDAEPNAEENGLPEVRFSPGDEMDVRVTINDSIIQMRLQEWVGRIMEAAG